MFLAGLAVAGSGYTHPVTTRAASNAIEIGRLGWLAKGVLYVLLGWLVIQVGLGDTSGEDAGATGALRAVADTPVGGPLLIVLGIGFVLYAAWRVLSAWRDSGDEPMEIAERVGRIGSALLYALLGIAALVIAFGGDGGSEDASGVVVPLMRTGWGRWAVAAIGVGFMAVAVGFGWRGTQREFKDEIDSSGWSSQWATAVEVFGVVGWVARAAVLGLVGVFVVRAALTFDPDDARSLDQMLSETAATSIGAALVVAAGVGLAIYGVFCLLTWRRRQL